MGLVVRNWKKKHPGWVGFSTGWWKLRFVPGAETSRGGRGVTGAAKSISPVLDGELATRLVDDVYMGVS